MARVFISIGSNINRQSNITSSLAALSQVFGELQLSSLYATQAVGFVGADFYNMVVQFSANVEVKAVAKQLKKIELSHGRKPNSHKYSARTLDLDLLLYDSEIINDGRLQIPRDEIIQYAFVLEPLAQIAPDEIHPTQKTSYGELWHLYNKSTLRQTVVAHKFNSDFIPKFIV